MEISKVLERLRGLISHFNLNNTTPTFVKVNGELKYVTGFSKTEHEGKEIIIIEHN